MFQGSAWIQVAGAKTDGASVWDAMLHWSAGAPPCDPDTRKHDAWHS